MTQTPILYVRSGRAVPALPAADTAPTFDVRAVTALPAPDALEADRAVVVLLDLPLAREAGMRGVRAIAARAAIVGIGPAGSAEAPEELVEDALAAYVTEDASSAAVRTALKSAARQAATLLAAERARAAAAARTWEIGELTRIGVALSTERDLPTLLAMILEQARRLSGADAGSLYLVESAEGSAPVLRFKLSQNQTLPELPFSEFTVPMDASSIAGAAAVTGRPLNFADVYALGPQDGFTFNRSFDEKFGYRTQSMVAIPMRTHRDEIVGVLQLINRKRSAAARLDSADAVAREVIAFDDHAVSLVSALASQAAVAIENGRLYEDIERLFEGFVMASVTAIESRDPTTSGHSFRVATFTTGLAAAVDRVASGPYADLRVSREQMRELRYASLLHDFGKVGVREQVLVKQKKLYPSDLAIIRHRFQFLLQRADLQYERERAQYLWDHGRTDYAQAVRLLEESRQGTREQLQKFLDAIVRANEPTILPEGTFEELEEINQRLFVDFDGIERPLLADDELRYLMINRGNLDERERREIESHVTHTYRFLEQIPWTRELKGIPSIAWGHHEKLDGSGYPRGVEASAIPVQTRMMTISDIYDALTATDRPYKRAVPAERALDILHDEAKHGHVDGALLGAFVEARVFELASRGKGN